MMELIFSMSLFLFPLLYSPGPGNMFFAANGARFGLNATWGLSAGYHFGIVVLTGFLGFGFALLNAQFPQFFTIIQYVGAAYVLYLSFKFFKAGTLKSTQAAKAANFGDGFILIMLNPKAYAVLAIVLSEFMTETGQEQATAILLIALITMVNNFIAFTLWTLVGDKIAARFRDKDDAKKLNLFFGAMLFIVAIWMAVA